MIAQNTTIAMEADGKRRTIRKDAVEPVAQCNGSRERLCHVMKLKGNEGVVVSTMVDHQIGTKQHRVTMKVPTMDSTKLSTRRGGGGGGGGGVRRTTTCAGRSRVPFCWFS